MTVSSGTSKPGVTAMASVVRGTRSVEGRRLPRSTSVWALETNTRYTVRATAADDTGQTVTEHGHRSGHWRASRTFSTRILEGYRKTLRVTPMQLSSRFPFPISNKRAVERSLESDLQAGGEHLVLGRLGQERCTSSRPLAATPGSVRRPPRRRSSCRTSLRHHPHRAIRHSATTSPWRTRGRTT